MLLSSPASNLTAWPGILLARDTGSSENLNVFKIRTCIDLQ